MKKIIVAFALLFALTSLGLAQETPTPSDKNCTVEKCKSDKNCTTEKCKTDTNGTRCHVSNKDKSVKCHTDKKNCSNASKNTKCTKGKTDKASPKWSMSGDSNMTKPACCRGKKKEESKKGDAPMKCAAGKCGGNK